jgi:hypothetical protein
MPEAFPEVQNLPLVFRSENQLLGSSSSIAGEGRYHTTDTGTQNGS